MPTNFENCEARKDSGKALLVYLPDLDEERWIPHSVIHEDSEVYDDEDNSKGTLVVKDWFAAQERMV